MKGLCSPVHVALVEHVAARPDGLLDVLQVLTLQRPTTSGLAALERTLLDTADLVVEVIQGLAVGGDGDGAVDGLVVTGLQHLLWVGVWGE